MIRNTFSTASFCTAVLLASGCASSSANKAKPPPPPASTSKPTARKTPKPEAPPPPAPAQPKAKPGKPAAKKPDPAAATYMAQCGGKTRDLAEVLAPIVAKMVKQKIPYAQKPANEWRDCSGNFLRLTSYLAGACPEQKEHLAAPAGIGDYKPGRKNVAPNGGKVAARTTRALAKWYHERGNFTPVFYDDARKLTDAPADLEEIRNLIRPGAVLWFSLRSPKSEGGVDALFKRNPAKTHIHHMGTVTKVERDANGDVIRYEMYHGLSTGKKANVTKHHYWVWPKSFTSGGQTYPPFGYWNQRLVGIGTIVPTKGT